MISTFIFDWSGTISDDRKPVYEANMRLLERYGKKRMTFSEWIPKSTPSVREFLANEGITIDPEILFKEFTSILEELTREGIVPEMYSDVPKTLEALLNRGKKLFVISSHPEAILQAEAKKYKLTDYFTNIQGNAKNKTDAIVELLQTINTKPSKDVAYIGDIIFDVQSAKKANIFSIGITTGYHARERLEKENPDKVIDAFSELLEL